MTSECEISVVSTNGQDTDEEYNMIDVFAVAEPYMYEPAAPSSASSSSDGESDSDDSSQPLERLNNVNW